jgi:hypothetical protein
MFIIDYTSETRIFVKILFSENGLSALSTVHYFRNEMKVDFFQRWKWYFEYRAALLRVKYPKAYIALEHGPYEYILPEHEYQQKIRNRYIADKAQLTKFKHKLDSISQNYNQIFPIEEHPDYKKINAKLEEYREQLKASELEYNKVFNK